ncbi:EAL domain-containing protein [Arcobacter sp. FWKO B]|uniref:EAL domain-containing protein n=1 Tax=Arcobacter sp. FWKO B TaxID=2593672 RepID=UPI001D17F1F0|nr:EAL domain-containing protein [Arcobacter sp. FWKO B]
MLPNRWEKALKELDFAFQPIVGINNGKIVAVEALLRNTKEAGFLSIFNCFDEAFSDGVLYQFDLKLRLKALKKFSLLGIDNIQLFYNLDNRLLYMPDYKTGNTKKLLDELNLSKKTLCFEMSEKGTLKDPNSITNMVNMYKQEGFDIAIDDFGTGISGLKLLYYSEPNFIKIDRFFIQNIQTDSKKRHFCSSIIKMAHTMGIRVIAEGVETIEEYYTCKDIGADLIQGYMIQKPKTDITKIKIVYSEIRDLYKEDKRKSELNIIDKDKIEIIDPLNDHSSLHELFSYFKTHQHNIFVPIIDKFNHLIGVIEEKDIKKISYSQYGLALAQNTSFSTKLGTFIKKVVSAEVSWGIDKVLELYNINESEVNNGIFLTQNGKYYGFIGVHNLLLLSYKRNLEIAKDQNPLTKLPGNKKIDDYINDTLNELNDNIVHFVYFDFNDFKPFNDIYGFRQGDRAILLFADLLNKLPKDIFVGHIGGDDFFLGVTNSTYENIYHIVQEIQINFERSAKNLYKKEDLVNGFILAKDRFTILRKFDLLSVSAGILEVRSEIDSKFDELLGELKKSSKLSKNPVGISIL